jgi:hypothetical protein
MKNNELNKIKYQMKTKGLSSFAGAILLSFLIGDFLFTPLKGFSSPIIQLSSSEKYIAIFFLLLFPLLVLVLFYICYAIKIKKLENKCNDISNKKDRKIQKERKGGGSQG